MQGYKNYYSGNTHGYSNLLGHVSSKYSDYKVIMKTKLPSETILLKKATNLYEWLFQIIINRLPINATKRERMDNITMTCQQNISNFIHIYCRWSLILKIILHYK